MCFWKIHLLAKRSVTKEKLASWLETVCCILDQHAVPWLEKAASLPEDISVLKNEKITDQERIITLQNQLIIQQQDQLKSVQEIVQTTVHDSVKTEMKTYASTVSKSCTSAFAPKKLQSVVRKVAVEEERLKNVIVYGLTESDDENLQGKVELVLSELEEKPVIRDCLRVGVRKENSVRPIKFSVGSADHAAQVIRKARMLRTKEGYSSIYLCPDRTLEERKAYKKLVEEVKMKRIAEPDKVFSIKNNKIISSIRTESASG